MLVRTKNGGSSLRQKIYMKLPLKRLKRIGQAVGRFNALLLANFKTQKREKHGLLMLAVTRKEITEKNQKDNSAKDGIARNLKRWFIGMINWPNCPIHFTPMDLIWVAGKLQYVCKACQEAPLTYSTTTVSEKEVKWDG